MKTLVTIIMFFIPVLIKAQSYEIVSDSCYKSDGFNGQCYSEHKVTVRFGVDTLRYDIGVYTNVQNNSFGSEHDFVLRKMAIDKQLREVLSIYWGYYLSDKKFFFPELRNK